MFRCAKWRSEIKTEEYGISIDLINKILYLKPHSYPPSIITADVRVEKWYSKCAAYMKQPRKWNRAVVAKTLCEIDTLITEARITVVRSSTSILLPDEIIDFESYMQDVRDVAEIEKMNTFN